MRPCCHLVATAHKKSKSLVILSMCVVGCCAQPEPEPLEGTHTEGHQSWGRESSHVWSASGRMEGTQCRICQGRSQPRSCACLVCLFGACLDLSAYDTGIGPGLARISIFCELMSQRKLSLQVCKPTKQPGGLEVLVCLGVSWSVLLYVVSACFAPKAALCSIGLVGGLMAGAKPHTPRASCIGQSPAAVWLVWWGWCVQPCALQRSQLTSGASQCTPPMLGAPAAPCVVCGAAKDRHLESWRPAPTAMLHVAIREA